MNHLDALFGPDLVAAITELVDARVAEALARQQPRDNGSPWLTVAQAAERLGCSEDAVRMRVKRGRLVARRQGRRVYVSRASVVELDR